MFNWLLAAAVLVVIAAVVVVFVVRKRSNTVAADTRPPLLVLVRALAVVFAGVTAVGTVAVIIQTLIGRVVSVSVPVAEFWPKAYPWVTIQHGPTALVVGGGFSSADVSASGLDFGTRMLQSGGQLLQGAMIVTIALTVAVLCHRLLGDAPFRPVVARSFGFAAVAVMVGGFGWQICFQAAGNAAAQQVLRVTGWESETISFKGYDPNAFLKSGHVAPGAFDPLSTGLPQPGMTFNIEFWPLFLGLALAALAIAFRYGERLQRDTDGLV